MRQFGLKCFAVMSYRSRLMVLHHPVFVPLKLSLELYTLLHLESNNLFSLYKSLMSSFEELSKADEELLPPVLHAIEKHWGKVSPKQLPQILADIQSVNSLIGRDLSSTHDRLLAILKGRQRRSFGSIAKQSRPLFAELRPKKSCLMAFQRRLSV